MNIDTIKYIQIDSFYLRDTDKHFITLGNELHNYQSKVRHAAYKYVKNWSAAIDIGAHIGIFTSCFSKKFNQVCSFEPMIYNRICLEKNIASNVVIYPYGLGSCEGVTEMRYNFTNSGGSEVIDPNNIAPNDNFLQSENKILVEIRTLDSFLIKEVGLVKVDVQGVEEHVLNGAENTLKEYKPVVILEEKVVKSRPNDRSAIERARNIILGYNYKFAETVGNDSIYIHK